MENKEDNFFTMVAQTSFVEYTISEAIFSATHQHATWVFGLLMPVMPHHKLNDSIYDMHA